MSFIPDELEKTIKIPIQVRHGKVEFYFGGPLPTLEEGVIGDLVVPAFAVLDSKARKLFSEERKIPLFKKATLLYVQLRPRKPEHTKDLAAYLLQPFLKGTLSYIQLEQETPEVRAVEPVKIQDHSLDTIRVFARIELQDVLYLQLRGTKAPTLSQTPCKVPALNKDARSVNHACTLLSEEIERQRISHTTNVFKTVYFLRRKPDGLCPLDAVRQDRTILFDERFDDGAK